MKCFDIDWTDFIRRLPLWNQLSPRAREALVALRGGQGANASVFQGQDRLLAEHDFVEHFAGGGRVRLTRAGAVFATAIRAMIRHDILAHHDASTLLSYLLDHFSRQELEAAYQEVCQPHVRYSYYSSRSIAHDLAHRVASTQWVEQFLAASAGKSGAGVFRRVLPSWLRNVEGAPRADVDLDAVRRLVRHLMELAEPLPLVELPARWNDLLPAALGPAIRHGIERLVLFPAMRLPDMTPMLGLWPGIHQRLHRPKPVAPPAVQPREVFHGALIVEDMTTVLVAASGRPLRLRQNDFQLFAKAQSELQEALLPLPDWAAETLEYSPDSRLPIACDWLQRLKLARRAGKHGKDLRLEMTAEGEAWLGQTAKRRLQIVLDALRSRCASPVLPTPYADDDSYDDEEYESYYDRGPIPFLPASLHVSRRDPKEVEAVLRREVVAAFGSLAEDRFVGLDEFLAWRAQEANPLPGIMGGNATRAYRDPYEMLHEPTIEALEEGWARFLKEMLRRRLVVLGAARWGVDEKAGRVCFAITGAGRYLLGLAEDFEYSLGAEASGQLVVQPNFDVVFLAASPLAEVSVARFAERKGRGVGTLFTITKKSILAAAGSGMTAAQVLDALQNLSAKPVPPNVAREISGWFDQCRRIQIRPAVLIHCPDADTALRVVSAGRNRAKALTDTVVELTEPRSKSELVRKLQAVGIFVDRTAANV